MNDDLRDRIAAVIDKQYTTGVSHRTYDDWLKHTADAVIRELRLNEAAQDCRCHLRHLWETGK